MQNISNLCSCLYLIVYLIGKNNNINNNLILHLPTSLRASSQARGLGFCWGEGVGVGKRMRACSDVSRIWMPPLIPPTASCWQSCQNLTYPYQAGKEFNVNKHVTSASRRESCWEKFCTFWSAFFTVPPKKQENNSERFNFIVSTLNVVNPKFA